MANPFAPARRTASAGDCPEVGSEGMGGTSITVRAAQFGGLAIAAYVVTAVFTGHGVASADVGEAGSAGSATSSAQHDARAATTTGAAQRPSSRRPARVHPRGQQVRAAAADGTDTVAPGPRSRIAGSAQGARKQTNRATGGAGSDAPVVHTDTVAGETNPLPGNLAGGPAPASAIGEPARVPVLGHRDSSLASPATPLGTGMDFSPLGWLRRTFLNRSPVINYNVSLNAQDMTNGVITGNLGAVDPEGDRLSFTVVSDPRYGTVVIDQLTGDFTYSPTDSFAQAGGADAFNVTASDGHSHLLAQLLGRDPGPSTARIAVPVQALSEPTSPSLEAFQVDKVITFDLPDGVIVTGADLSPDGQHLVVDVKVNGSSQIAVTNLDGGEYQCLTCGLVPNASKAIALQDNQRIWFANTSGQQSANGGGGQAIVYSMLECEGSISACQNPTVKNVEFPSDRRWLPLPVQNREAKPDPYGEYVTWTANSVIKGPRMSIAKLVETPDGYELVDHRVFNPQWNESTAYAADFANATRFYEGASWHAGGRYLKYQTTSTGLNYDIYLLDTATGERRQLTTDLDYNESGDVAPDGQSVYFSSARGLDRMDVFTALQRPSLLDSAAFPQIGRVSLWNNRRSLNEPWLMDLSTGQQLDGYSGQPIIIDPDWTIRGWSWFPDSTRAVISEQQRPDGVSGPGAPDTPWRISIISFPTRTPSVPLEPVHQDPEAIATWSVPAREFKPMMGRQVPCQVLKGQSSGTATLQYLGIYGFGVYSVTYKNYSDDGKTFINGTESVTIFNPLGNSIWSANLTSEGERTGYLKGTIKIGAKNEFSGDVTSEINGIRYSGVPTQAELPPISQPQLAISPSGDKIRVTATVAEDGQPRPVRGVAVTVGSTTVITDEHGYAQIAFAPGDTVTAVAGGFQSASQQVPLG